MPIDFPSNPTNGQVFSNWIYDSSITAWRNVNTDTGIGTLNAMGLKNVVPISVSVGAGSATINANGLVTFSNANAIGLNGVFTNTFKNYRLMVNLRNTTGNTDNLFLRLRSGGTDNSSNYTYSGIDSSINSAGTFNGNYNGAWRNSLSIIGYATPTSGAGFVEISQAAESTTSQILSHYVSLNSVTNAQYFRNYSTTHEVSSSFDGFNVWPGANLISGTIQVFGYTN